MRAESTLTGPSRVLAAIATVMLQLALYERQGAVASDWIQLGIAILLACVIRATSGKSDVGPRVLTSACFAILVLLPFVWDAFQRSTAHWGQPFEVQLASTLRNLMLGLAAKRADVRGHKFAALASCFLALASILWLMNRWTVALLFVYTIVGMWWLMGVYWDRLSGCFLSHTERKIPWKPLVAAGGLGVLGLFFALPFVSGRHITTALEGFLPSSGGTQWQDEHAYGGIGDGPQMVSAKDNASGFGPIESELFLESKMPSLYDCFNEFSDAPPKRKKKPFQRAIPLAPISMQQNHQRRGANQQPGREFNAIRRSKQETTKVSDLRSHALLQVAGRVPVHLGLHTYDLWDGHTLASSNSSPARALYLDTKGQDGRAWARYTDAGENDLLGHRDRHELRIINLKTNRVPSPPNSTGVHLDKLHTETFFNVTQDGMLALDWEFIPQLTVMHVESLQRSSFDKPELVSSPLSTLEASDRIVALAREWTAGVDESWRQVETICQRLRQEYVLDAKHMAPEDVDDAAAHFLFDSKRGPDYLFATSAALLIRSLGYESRVVSGFYANPEHYDRQSRLTSVYADDVHFWVEVLASAPGNGVPESSGRSHWLAVEPSPGYDVLLAPESIWATLFTRASLTWHTLKRNPLPTLASLALCVIAWINRTVVCDLLITAWWRLHYQWGGVRHRVISTLRLLDRRAYVRGIARAKSVPIGRWKLTTANCGSDSDSWVEPFRELANWALYGDGSPLEFTALEVNSLCREAAAVAYRSPPKPMFVGARQDRGTV